MRWLVVGGAGAFVFLAALWLFWLPQKVEDKFVSTVESNLGLKVDVGSASAGLLSVAIDEVVIGGDDGVDIEVERIVVPSSPIRLAFFGASAIDEVRVQNAKVNVDTTKPSAMALIRRFARRSQGGKVDKMPKTPRALPALELNKLDVEVRDAHGSLVLAKDVDLGLTDQGKRLSAAQVTLGDDSTDKLELQAVVLLLGPESRELSVGSGQLRPGADTSRERLAARVLQLRDRLRGDVVQGDEDAPSEAPTTRLIVQQMTVFPASNASKPNEPVVDYLSIHAERTSGKPWHLQGEGRPRGDGKLSWNLDVDREALTAKGNVHFERLPLFVLVPFMPALPWYRPEATQLSGDLKVKSASAAEARFEASLEVENLGLSSERVASAPVSGISFIIEADGSWETGERKLTIDSGAVRVERAEARFAGSAFRLDDKWGLSLMASLPPTRCGDAVAAIPTDLLAEVSGFSWQGQIAGSIRAEANSESLDDAKLRVEVNDGCRFESAPSIAELGRYREPFTHRVLEGVDADGREDWFEMAAGPGSVNWTSIWGISPFFVHAVLAHEDASFFRHTGFAPWAIRGAFRRNLKAGRYVVGASTISMQLAKNLFLHREKTLARKAQEVILTWWLESRWDKKTILETYLNVIEYGPGVYGVTAAAEYYFGRDPSELSLAESAFLATILPNPKKYHASFARGSLSPSVANKMRFLIRHMGRKARVDEVAVEHALAEVDRFTFQKPDESATPGHRTFVGTAAALPYMVEGPVDSPIATEQMVWDDETYLEPGDPEGEELN